MFREDSRQARYNAHASYDNKRVGVDASATTSLFVETSNTRVLCLVLRDNARIFYGYGEILEYRVWKEIGLSINRDQTFHFTVLNNFGWKDELVEETYDFYCFIQTSLLTRIQLQHVYLQAFVNFIKNLDDWYFKIILSLFFFTIEIDYETKWFFSLKRSQAIVGDTKRDIQIFWHASRTRKETSRELCWLERWRRNVLGSDCGW